MNNILNQQASKANTPTRASTGRPPKPETRNLKPQRRFFAAGIFSPASEKLPILLKMDYVGCIGMLGRQDLAALIRKTKLPAINIFGGRQDFGFPQVGVNDMEIGAMGADYLIRQGFSSFAFYGLPGQDFSDSRQFGFIQRLKERGFEADVYDEARTYPATPLLKKVSKDLASYPPVRWVAQLPLQTGILASDDIRGSFMSNCIDHLCLHMPEDLGLLGIGNDHIRCETTRVPMSSIELPAQEVGYEAARCLDVLLAGKKKLKFPRFRPPLCVIERQSTDLLKVDHPNVAKALTYMQEEGRQKIMAEQVARTAGMSLRSLERAFQKVLGRTIQQELIRIRLEWAKRDLRTTDNNLDQVGSECGLNSGVYLSQLFKKIEGISPGEYRRQFRH